MEFLERDFFFSILPKTHQDWEWVLVTLGDALSLAVPFCTVFGCECVLCSPPSTSSACARTLSLVVAYLIT